MQVLFPSIQRDRSRDPLGMCPKSAAMQFAWQPGRLVFCKGCDWVEILVSVDSGGGPEPRGKALMEKVVTRSPNAIPRYNAIHQLLAAYREEAVQYLMTFQQQEAVCCWAETVGAGRGSEDCSSANDITRSTVSLEA